MTLQCGVFLASVVCSMSDVSSTVGARLKTANILVNECSCLVNVVFA
jgi:hypothetical protein